MSSIYRIYRAEPSWYAPADPSVRWHSLAAPHIIHSDAIRFPESRSWDVRCAWHARHLFCRLHWRIISNSPAVLPEVLHLQAIFYVIACSKNRFFCCHTTDTTLSNISINWNGPWCREALSAPSRTLARISGRARRAPGTCRNLRWRKFKRKFIEITLLILLS